MSPSDIKPVNLEYLEEKSKFSSIKNMSMPRILNQEYNLFTDHNPDQIQNSTSTQISKVNPLSKVPKPDGIVLKNKDLSVLNNQYYTLQDDYSRSSDRNQTFEVLENNSRQRLSIITTDSADVSVQKLQPVKVKFITVN